MTSEAFDDKQENDNDASLPVVADLSYDIDVLTVEQAVMRIELSGENMLMFRNASHFGLNVVHREAMDPSVGLIHAAPANLQPRQASAEGQNILAERHHLPRATGICGLAWFHQIGLQNSEICYCDAYCLLL